MNCKIYLCIALWSVTSGRIIAMLTPPNSPSESTPLLAAAQMAIRVKPTPTTATGTSNKNSAILLNETQHYLKKSTSSSSESESTSLEGYSLPSSYGNPSLWDSVKDETPRLETPRLETPRLETPRPTLEQLSLRYSLKDKETPRSTLEKVSSRPPSPSSSSEAGYSAGPSSSDENDSE